MTERSREFVSFATDFDSYRGTINWQNLSVSERRTIAQYLITDQPVDFDIQAFVMGSNLRRIQYDGLLTVVIRVALALQDNDGSHRIDCSKVLPSLADTALGEELASLLDGTATDETNYRMGELEFLAQSGSRASPLDRLLDLPKELRLAGILQLLKPKVTPVEGGKSSGDPNSLPFSEVVKLVNSKAINVYASYSGSLHAVSIGLVRLGAIGWITTVGMWLLPLFGILAAIFISGWLFFFGVFGAVVCFKIARKAASQAVLRKCLSSKALFDMMRSNGIIWLEYIPRKGGSDV